MVLAAVYLYYFVNSERDLTSQGAFYYRWNHYPDSNLLYFREGAEVAHYIAVPDIVDKHNNSEDIAGFAADNTGYTEYFSVVPAGIDSSASVQDDKYSDLPPFSDFFFLPKELQQNLDFFFPLNPPEDNQIAAALPDIDIAAVAAALAAVDIVDIEVAEVASPVAAEAGNIAVMAGYNFALPAAADTADTGIAADNIAESAVASPVAAPAV